jgi:hypothetical protein
MTREHQLFPDSHPVEEKIREEIEKKSREKRYPVSKLVYWSMLLAFFAVAFLWGFWSKGVTALGLNFSIFLALLLVMFFHLTQKNPREKETLLWLVPTGMIVLSFTLFENPFLKNINVFLVLPIIVSLFFAYTLIEKTSIRQWNFELVLRLIVERISFLGDIARCFSEFFETLSPLRKKTGFKKFRSILLGILIFLFLAFVVIIPLLSSADPAFGERLSEIVEFLGIAAFFSWLGDLFQKGFFWRAVFFFFLVPALMAYFYALPRKGAVIKWWAISPVKKTRDSVVAGIVVGGTLVLYLLFLWVQLESLWTVTLPEEFQRVETVTKKGFWQLFFLSLLNIFFFFFYYRKTNSTTQKILTAFTIASLALLLLAGKQMFLYVYYYGLSYEKFFATYVVIYCTVLFVWLIKQLFSENGQDVVRFLVFSLLWMYAVLTILPVERFIFTTNASLAQQEDSRINIYELRMLSSDVYPLVTNYREDEKWKERWSGWHKKWRYISNKKHWYEKNLSDMWVK